MIKIWYNLALFLVINANFFAEFFGKNIEKIITSVPDWAKFRRLGAFFGLWAHFILQKHRPKFT
jgi:hypothetical protein